MGKIIQIDGNVKWYRGRHASTCECRGCLKEKLRKFEERVENMHGVKPPSADHSIPVRAHWRIRHKSDNQRDAFLSFVQSIVNGMLDAASSKGAAAKKPRPRRVKRSRS